MKCALITGISGQDGSYLSEFLLSKNYTVLGVDKNTTQLINKVKYFSIDLTDPVELYNLLKSISHLDEVYNFAAVTSIPEAIKRPVYSGEINALMPQMMMEFLTQFHPKARFFQASSSAMYGDTLAETYNEEIFFKPNNPYAITKLYAHNIANYYRNSRSLAVSCGILFNHESPRRGLHFVTQKIAYAAACAKLKIKTSEYLNEEGEPIFDNYKIKLGNLEAKRDWGFAGDYVKAMWLMLQQSEPDDYIIGTGEIHTIKELCQEAFLCVGLDYQKYIEIDPRFVRADGGVLIADASKAKKVLGWQPKVNFKELIRMMVDANLSKLKQTSS